LYAKVAVDFVTAEWQAMGGVLLVGYEMYRLLTTKRVLAKPKRTGRKAAAAMAGPMIIDLEEEDCNQELLKSTLFSIQFYSVPSEALQDACESLR